MEIGASRRRIDPRVEILHEDADLIVIEKPSGLLTVPTAKEADDTVVALLEDYLPKQLDDAELAELVRAAVIEAGATEPRQLGGVMKLVQPRVAGRADGRRVSDEVRRHLSS